MTEQQLVTRLLKGMAMIDADGRKLNQSDWSKLHKASNYLLDKNLFIDDDPNKSVADMQSMCRKLKRTEGLDLVIIDYLQKVKSSIRGTKREQLEQVSNDIKIWLKC